MFICGQSLSNRNETCVQLIDIDEPIDEHVPLRMEQMSLISKWHWTIKSRKRYYKNLPNIINSSLLRIEIFTTVRLYVGNIISIANLESDENKSYHVC